MANVTINDLTLEASPVGTDEIEVQKASGGQPKKLTFNQIPWKGGALVELTSDQTNVADDTDEVVSWDQAEYDTDTFWAGGAPTRLTVPTGVTRVQVFGGILWSSEATSVGYRKAFVTKNGASTAQGLTADMVNGGSEFDAVTIVNSFVTPPLIVAATDYFELVGRHTQGAATPDILSHVYTYLGIMILERTS